MGRIIDISMPLEERTAVFPGDVPLSLKWTAQMSRGDSCNVSRVSGSSHAGTHVDLPLHFGSPAQSQDLDAYVGPAIVVSVTDLSVLDNIQNGMRVLIKSRTEPNDHTEFPAGFAAPTQELVDRVVRSQAVLLGIDVPSVDPEDSKSLPNHHALASAGVAILENLELAHVECGAYELIALPLRIPGLDATWVRAVLREV